MRRVLAEHIRSNGHNRVVVKKFPLMGKSQRIEHVLIYVRGERFSESPGDQQC